MRVRENKYCPAKLHRDLGSVAILFDCSVFLLHKSVKLDVFGVVGSRRNFYSKHRKGVPFPYFCPPGRSEIACWEVSQTLYENGKERKTMNGRKRTIQVKFYVTEEERKLIEEKMKLVPTNNMAAYLRKIAIDGYIIQVDHTDIKAMTAEIQKRMCGISRQCAGCFPTKNTKAMPFCRRNSRWTSSTKR